jgi:PEP-CTERM motif
MSWKLSVFVLFFLAGIFALPVYADSVNTPNGTLFIPDGSTITSEYDTPPGSPMQPYTTLYFSFADGTGQVTGQTDNGEGGFLAFTVPVFDVSFQWTGFYFTASDNVGDSFTNYPPGTNEPATVDFSGTGITKITFSSSNDTGGITSISYAEDGPSLPVPEPSSLFLLVAGLGLFTTFQLMKHRNWQA